ncbi:ABC transporter permease [Sedimentitalea sp. HM32M-2]|uniref:ABC transporter permease n=1 Tax=Sedimentitalea sp. HM32M-2 TaxID=3351566 RepID=UPI00363EF903
MSLLPPLTPPSPPVVGPAAPRRMAAARVILALILREMSTRYGRTPGGYVWGILEPLAAILFLSVGFSLVMRSPSLGTSFLLFYATGYLPFNLYQTLSGMIGAAIRFSKPLLKYPAVTWLDAVLARFLLNSLTGILVTIILLTGILAVIDSRATLDLPPMVLAMALAMALGLGVGTVNCAISGLFPIWELIWSILTRPLFIASGIFFLYDNMPPMAQDLLWFNPLIHIVGLMRTGFYPTYSAGYVDVVYVLGLSLGLLAMGLLLLGRYHRDILNR